MDSVHLILLLSGFVAYIKGQVFDGDGITLFSFSPSITQTSSAAAAAISEASTNGQESTASANMSSNVQILQSTEISDSIAGAIIQKNFDAAVDFIYAADFKDVGAALTTLQTNKISKNLAELVLYVVAMNDRFQQIKISSGLEEITQSGNCDFVVSVFKEIDKLIVNKAIVGQLQEVFGDAKKIMSCIHTFSANEPVVRFVPPQNACIEGSISCWWWQKEGRHLLHSSSQYCEYRYVCNHYGFNYYYQCQNQCLN